MEGKQIAQLEERPLTAIQIRAQVQVIQQVLDAVMKKDVHYGTVPGCQKPSLLKPGAEKIMVTFRLSADPQIDDISSADEIRYRVKVVLKASDGRFVGAGVGECSSSEEKYKWRRAVCEAEYEATPEDRRREKWNKAYKAEPYTIKQVRTVPSDMANTVLKMAKKRALVDAVLTATAASDIFDQDLEDLPEGLLNDNPVNAKPAVDMPEPLPTKQSERRPEPEPQDLESPADQVDDSYITIEQAIKVKPGGFFHTKGNLVSVTRRKVKARGEDTLISTYTVKDDTGRIAISVWDDVIPMVKVGDMLEFVSVQVTEYKGAIQRMAQEVTIC